MTLFEVVLLLAVFLCALTAGLVYTFAVVVMPGLTKLPDRDFLLAFRVMDSVIQQNEPRFLIVWVGSVLALIIACVLGMAALEGIDRGVLLAATVAYVLGVQAPTIAVNVPLNNRLQALVIDDLTAAELRAERNAFEKRWNDWNRFRTIVASACILSLLLVCTRL